MTKKSARCLIGAAALAVGLIGSSGAHAKETPWYTFYFADRTCTTRYGTPDQLANFVRRTMRSEPDIENIGDPARVVILTVPSPIEGEKELSVITFRDRADCEDYANSTRIGSKKYERRSL